MIKRLLPLKSFTMIVIHKIRINKLCMFSRLMHVHLRNTNKRPEKRNKERVCKGKRDKRRERERTRERERERQKERERKRQKERERKRERERE